MIAMSINLETLVATTPTRPTLQKHHNGYSWTSYWRDDRKKLRTKRLGKKQSTSRQQATARWNNWLATEWTPKPHVQNPDSDPAKFAAPLLASLYRAHAQAIYKKRGEATSHMSNVNQAMDAMESAWAGKAMVEVKAHDLAALRDSMIFDVDGEPRAVSTVNDRLSIIKSAIIWGATEKGYFPDERAYAICQVKPLKAGRCKALPPEEVKPVDNADRLAAMKQMPTVLRDMTDVQRLSGMRSGELVTLRGTEIDTKPKIWCYVPDSHKTEHFGKARAVFFGPRAQKILKKYLDRPIGDYLFNPREAHAERLQVKRASRKTKLWPSHRKQRPCRPSLNIGSRYTVDSYRRAIWYACIKAKVKPWHPHQLRHSFGTEVREKLSLEHAADGMGNSPDVAKIYAERSLNRAKEAARKVG